MSGFDYVLVGGGLQSGLIALALRARQPAATVALVERAAALGGNHTWCFHRSDVPPGSLPWLEPLVTYRWPGYRVLFPGLERSLEREYAGVSSERLHEVVSAAVRGRDGSELVLGAEATSLGAHTVRLTDGRELRGRVVVDARGPSKTEGRVRAGYQKFLGLEATLERPHGLDRPILMDATVDQSEGYRFFYVLPLDERTVLVEDTYFHDSPALDAEGIRSEVRAYMERRGWSVATLRREERGVLPMPWAGGLDAARAGPLIAGYRGGWFHPGTGYSFPVALRLAEHVASRPAEALFGPELQRLARAHRRQAAFARFLNGLLFRWYPPAARRSIFARFYRLPDDTVGNWYALRLRWRDAFRMLFGRPPRGLSIRHRLRPPTRCAPTRDLPQSRRGSPRLSTRSSRRWTIHSGSMRASTRRSGTRPCWIRRATSSPGRERASGHAWRGMRGGWRAASPARSPRPCDTRSSCSTSDRWSSTTSKTTPT